MTATAVLVVCAAVVLVGVAGLGVLGFGLLGQVRRVRTAMDAVRVQRATAAALRVRVPDRFAARDADHGAARAGRAATPR